MKDEVDNLFQASTAALVLGITGGFGGFCFCGGSVVPWSETGGRAVTVSSFFGNCLAATTGGLAADGAALVSAFAPVSSSSRAACKIAVMEELAFFRSAGTGVTDEGADELTAAGSDGWSSDELCCFCLSLVRGLMGGGGHGMVGGGGMGRMRRSC